MGVGRPISLSMKLTGRFQGSIAPSKRDAFLSTHSGEDIVRQAKVEKLRRLVAKGRYHVDADGLANEILHHALSRKAR